ncbi:unnamed protein product [Rhizoctonia solani]|uniref:Uncharacterized protein n=1 Tax=Rhizoctonia solani TaxID=456999 RepID=A0A8H3BLI3_9AGAM|nr:unnamed protein product [Rhizoctonia solani]
MRSCNRQADCQCSLVRRPPRSPQAVADDIAFTLPYGGGCKGRVHRKRTATAVNKDAGGDEEDEESYLWSACFAFVTQWKNA